MTAADDLRRYLAGAAPYWQEIEPRTWKRTLAQGYALEVRDTAVGWLAHLRREGERPFFLREVHGVADLEAITAVLEG